MDEIQPVICLFTIFAFIALLWSSVGIYAVISYAVTERTREIGIRMAPGASRANILRLVLSLGGKHLAIGLGLGLEIAFGLTRVLAALLFGVSPTDPITFVTIILVLAAVGMFLGFRRGGP